MRKLKNLTEDEILEIIERVINRISFKFVFAYHSIEDLKQQARMLAIEGLQRYDESRPLENFLSVHVKNRLCNFKRKYFRIDKPCLHCPLKAYNKKEDKCEYFDEFTDCVLYNAWLEKNNQKKNIVNPIGITYVVDDKEDNMRMQNDLNESLYTKELFELIDKHIPIEFREDWLKLTHGVRISDIRKNNLYEIVSNILIKEGIDEEGVF